jgi:hypothetical protein
MRDLWWTKWHWGRFPPNTLVSPANYFTDCSTLIIYQSWSARVRAWVRSCRICGGQIGTGEDFHRILQFPLPIISQNAPHISSSVNLGRLWFVPGSGHAGFVVDIVSLRKISTEYFGFPRHLFHRLFHTHHPSSAACTLGQIVTDVRSGPGRSASP